MNTYYRSDYTGAEDNTVIALDGQYHGNLLLGTDIQNIMGNFDGNLTIYANSTSNDDIEIADAEGVVSLVGGGGNDTLSADYADSTNAGATAYLQGGSGTSLLIPSTGVSRFSNGTGVATADFSNTTANIQIYLDGSQNSGDPMASAYDYENNFELDGPSDSFDGTVQNVIAGSGNDLIEGTGGNNILRAGSGTDTLVSNGGTDALFGGSGSDTFEARDASYTYIDGGSGTSTAYTDAFDTTYNVKSRNPDLAAPTQLTGTTIGTSGSYQNDGNTIAKVFDGNVNTYFDAPTASGSYVGLDLGTPQVVNQISFAPRAGWENRMVGGVIQGSNSASFAGASTIYTVNFTPASGALTTVGFANTTAYRYYRYIGPVNSFCNIAELKLFNTTQPFIAEDANGNLIINGTSGSDDISVSFDNDTENNFNVGDTFSYITESFTVAMNGYSETFNNNSIQQIVFNSGDGNDTVTVNGYVQNDDGLTTLPFVDLVINVGNGNDSVTTTLGHDENRPATNNDSVQITAGNGNDFISTQGGYRQTIVVGNGNDTVGSSATEGFSGAYITAGNGNDDFSAGSAGDGGDDIGVTAGTGRDTVFNSDYEDGAGMSANGGPDISGSIRDQTAAVGGIVFIDTNGDGKYEAGEPTIAGAQIYLDNNNDGVYDSGDTIYTADANGNYAISNLSPGQPYSTYQFGVILPPGTTLENPADALFTVQLSAGLGLSGYDFALEPVTKQLTGAVIGTTGSYRSQGNTAAKAFDGNLSTFFDAPAASGDWTGLDLGSPQVITQISYAPRSGWANRMAGGMFQGSSDPNFANGVVTLYTVTSAPVTGALTTVAISNTAPFRYVRYIGPANAYCNVAEAKFFGSAPTAGATLEPNGTLIVTGTSGADTIHVAVDFQASGDGPQIITTTVNSIVQIFDANLVKGIVINSGDGNDTINVDGNYEVVNTPYFDPTGNLATTINTGSGNDTVTASVYADNGSYEAPADVINLGSGTDTVLVDQDSTSTVNGGAGTDDITGEAVDGGSLYVYGGSGDDIVHGGPYEYDHFYGGTGTNTYYEGPDYDSGGSVNINLKSGDFSNIQNFIDDTPENVTITGSDGSGEILIDGGDNNVSITGGNGNDLIEIFDATTANITTGNGNNSVYVRNDNGTATVTGGSGNDTIDAADGSDPVTINGGGGTNTAYTKPGDIVTNIQVLNPTTTTQLTGKLIATAGSYQSNGNTAAKAVDGNLATYFDAPTANGDYVGLDLGTYHRITSISYAPRSGWAQRMVGGIFQVSDSPNFTNPTDIYTITTTPAVGVLTTVQLPNVVYGRYIRYLAPDGSYGNIAELVFDG